MNNSLHIRPSNKSVEVNLMLLAFEENGLHHLYSAELDLMGYGNTENEAQESFDIVCKEFLAYAVENGTLANELLEHGWSRLSNENKITPPGLKKGIIPATVINHNPTLSTKPIQIAAYA